MKKILLLLILNPSFSFSQDIPKFSNTIIAKGVSFQTIKDSLLSIGYFIDQQNQEDGTIITKPKGVCDCKNVNFHQLIIYVRVKDSVAKFSGTFNINYNNNAQRGGLFSNDRTEFHPLEYWKSSISLPHSIFMKMDKIVRTLSSDISYAKQ
jgi:hypothetical protein